LYKSIVLLLLNYRFRDFVEELFLSNISVKYFSEIEINEILIVIQIGFGFGSADLQLVLIYVVSDRLSRIKNETFQWA
jgi:hypothetical protein